jgi:hypothetical protein
MKKPDKTLMKILKEAFPKSEISVGYSATKKLIKKAAKKRR